MGNTQVLVLEEESAVAEFDVQTAALAVIQNHTTADQNTVPNELTIVRAGTVPELVVFNE